jgi:hypothetical protein
MFGKRGHVERKGEKAWFCTNVAGSRGGHVLRRVGWGHFERFDGRRFKCKAKGLEFTLHGFIP